jgi:hypothetical protein
MRGQAVERCGAKNGRRRDGSRSENEPLMNTERRGSNRLTRSSYVASPLRILAEMRKHPGGSGVNMAMFAAVPPDSSRCSAFISLTPSLFRWRHTRKPTAVASMASRSQIRWHVCQRANGNPLTSLFVQVDLRGTRKKRMRGTSQPIPIPKFLDQESAPATAVAGFQ